jgi:hypothetical protein
MSHPKPLAWMKRELSIDGDTYLECGEVQCTQLVEAYALAVDHPDAEIPDEWWDAGVKAAAWFERRSARGA